MDFELSLHTETIASAYTAEPLVVTPDTTVRDVLLLMKAQETSSVVVCTDGTLSGIFTERDALKVMAAGTSLETLIRDVMSRNVATLQEDATVGAVIETMANGGYRRLTVVDSNGKPICLAGARGIVHYLVDHFPESIYNLPPQPSVGQSEREGA